MASYLEKDELVIGKIYNCETYDGLDVILKYIGDNVFRDKDSIYYYLEGDVRYVYNEQQGDYHES